MADIDDPDELLTIGRASKIIGVTPSTVRKWEQRGLIAPVRTLGGHRRFRRADVEALLDPSDAA